MMRPFRARVVARQRGSRAESCDAKSPLPGPRKAVEVALRMRRLHHEAFVAYPCRFCGRWHVGALFGDYRD